MHLHLRNAKILISQNEGSNINRNTIKDRTLELDRHFRSIYSTQVVPPTSLMGLGYVVKGGADFNIIKHAAFL